MLPTVVWDVEIYRNYFLAAFESVKTGRVRTFELSPYDELDREGLRAMLKEHQIVGFNSLPFDIVIAWMAVLGYPIDILKKVADDIILRGKKPWDIEKQYDFKLPKNLDHIDLIETVPGVGVSLKIYNGRLHGRRMQDLPIEPSAVLTPEQMDETRDYCINDLAATKLLFQSIKGQLDLRETMGKEYRQDLRSKSEAQVAEAVIKARLEEESGERPERPVVKPGTTFRYAVPEYIRYETVELRKMLTAVREADFEVADSGKVNMPKALSGRKIKLGGSVYRMGIGGLHSSEEDTAHVADEHTIIADRDVASFYPAIILTLGLYPKHLGRSFLNVYRKIVNTRLAAKANGQKVVADSLKIVINGAFGKLGSKWSALYSPDLMLQVTVTGQLALLMLIERMELAGIPVVSANTDGIVMKCPKALEGRMLAVVKGWEADTGFETEETRYQALYSRDVNNYIAVKPAKDGKAKVKTKGAYANPWWEEDPDQRGQFMKNPQNTICVEAVIAFITRGMPIEETVRACKDVRKFVTVVKVDGGATKDGEYLGKAIRFIHSTETRTPILYKKAHPTTGNHKKVSRSEGARPLMTLPETLPADVDFDWYVNEAHEILRDIGYVQPSPLLELLAKLGFAA